MELADIAPAQTWRIQYRALVRLLLYFTGRTHQLLSDAHATMREDLVRIAGSGSSELDGLAQLQAGESLEETWKETYQTWRDEFQALRTQAAYVAFGGLSALNENFVRPALVEFQEQESVADLVIDGHVDAIVKAADRRIYEDGIPLSRRIWRVDHDARAGIRRELALGVATNKDAWGIAEQLQQYLGVAAGCPRWTRTRLRLTKKQIADGDVRGLRSGADCRGQGVAYNALRLARNELQVIHAMASDEIMAALPFVEKEQIFLSPSHPKEDECDDVVRGGENGDGVYAKGTVALPIHVHCLCLKSAVLMNPDDFSRQLGGWVRGADFPAMDMYAGYVGGAGIDMGNTLALGSFLVWAAGNFDDMEALFD